ncbi:hypothetical protein SDC9_160179 [bioreactor metagenome]|uniref:Uncharacterized protein n=1 Tax=bioreactor metagenome TaxID=1076179 RepID=A0A645FHN4_9ZZZZ
MKIVMRVAVASQFMPRFHNGEGLLGIALHHITRHKERALYGLPLQHG